MSWAEEHLFERHSVVREHELWRHALEHARGQNITLARFRRLPGDAITCGTLSDRAMWQSAGFERESAIVRWRAMVTAIFIR